MMWMGWCKRHLKEQYLKKIISGQGAKTNVCVGGGVGAKHVGSPLSSASTLEQEDSLSFDGTTI
jgi:hypothetical protein